jgi:uncharacterized protein YqjF (DUF2071 family)
MNRIVAPTHFMNPPLERPVFPARDQTRSDLARERFLATEQAPTFLCEWPRVLFVHYRVEPAVLQPSVPFELELFEGKAIVSLAAFSMYRFRPRRGGNLGEWLFRPASSNHFFNVRAYVRHGGESGVYFMTQWLSHPFCLLGKLPMLRLPWHLGRISCEHSHESGRLTGQVRGRGRHTLTYAADVNPDASFALSKTGTVAEFAMERYTAFALRGGRQVIFRVWHEPWPQCPVEVEVKDNGLLSQSGNWFPTAQLVGANYTVGCNEVWMGRVRAIPPGREDRFRTNRRGICTVFEMP